MRGWHTATRAPCRRLHGVQWRAGEAAGIRLEHGARSGAARRTYATGQESATEGAKRRWRETRIDWSAPIPLTLTLAVLAWLAYGKGVKLYQGGKEREGEGDDEAQVKVTGPWQVHVIGALPLKQLSRAWGVLNSWTLPVFLRTPVYQSYSSIFGCDLTEMKEDDLKAYRNLGEFFYRQLKEGARPIEASDLVSPADGRVLHFGVIEEGKVEQVKGMTYSLDALLGSPKRKSGADLEIERDEDESPERIPDDEFANVNGITYSLDNLMGGDLKTKDVSSTSDASVPHLSTARQQAQVVADVLPAEPRRLTTSEKEQGPRLKQGNSLYFAVVYLAPGDYHRFHSPTNWVCERRRHFSGELFSVSPYMAQRLANLFVLNERIVLLGRWKYGFFSMIPVGATNVGSIKINFDKNLRTNSTAKSLKAGTYTEATYAKSSRLLQGHPLASGSEMGGFSLGSTIVLVFEGPSEGWTWKVEQGQKIKMGETLATAAGV